MALCFTSFTFSQTAEDFVAKGDVIAYFKDYHGAIALYSKAIELNADLSNAYYRRGVAKAKLKDFKIVSYPDQVDPIKSLFENSGDKIKSYLMKRELGDQYIYYQQMQSAINLSGVQARIPYNIQVK